MLTRQQAFAVLEKTGVEASNEGAIETACGWYFPFAGDGVGCNGFVVSKKTGKVFPLGSAFSVERDLRLYDAGYQFERNDLVVTGVRNLERTVDTLLLLQMQIVEPRYEHACVWRVPRAMTRDEVQCRLSALPTVFGPIGLYFVAERLEEARARGDFTFEVLEYRASRAGSTSM